MDRAGVGTKKKIGKGDLLKSFKEGITVLEKLRQKKNFAKQGKAMIRLAGEDQEDRFRPKSSEVAGGEGRNLTCYLQKNWLHDEGIRTYPRM